jgi:hypothetical protein
MILQKFLSIAGLSIGFASAISFCAGVVMQSAKQMSIISGSYWGGNNALAEALAAQRAQYSAGALLLLVSFAIQVWAIAASQSIQVCLPQVLENEYFLALAFLLLSLCLAWPVAWLLYTLTVRKLKIIREASKTL